MWFPALGLSAPLVSLAAQVPLQPSNSPSHSVTLSGTAEDFQFKQGPNVFSPYDMAELKRPGVAVVNPAGDLLLVPVTQFSLQNKTNSLDLYLVSTESNAEPLEIPLISDGKAFWLDDRTIAHAVREGEGKDSVIALYSQSVKFETEVLSTPNSPVFIGKFPTDTAADFVFNSKSGYLVFSDQVYADGDIHAVKEHDTRWDNRGNSALVYEDTYIRHWDAWSGPKKASLFSVPLYTDSTGKWVLGTEYVNLLKDTTHHSPIPPFGGTNCFDVSATHVAYTSRDPALEEVFHTKQNVYLISLDGKSERQELTAGDHGTTDSIVFNPTGDKVAWVQLTIDGSEAAQGKIIVYDLKKDVRYTLTGKWDRSAGQLAFAPDGKTMYFTAADKARTKIFAMPIPETPASSDTEPTYSDAHHNPYELTHTGWVTGIKPLTDGRIVFARSSMTSPNDIFVLRGLLSEITPEVVSNLTIEQLTKFTAGALKGKSLSEGEEFWFDGAETKVQGWIIKPPGFKRGEKKKWPIVLLIHGGPFSQWGDQWWIWTFDMNIFAQQGYFVVAINPTGSTSFGQGFADAIHDAWGEKPFTDMINGWKYVLDNYPEVDPDRAVGAGPSWGGYCINWMQGHPEYGFNFKAVFTHDGAFDIRHVSYTTDEIFMTNYEFNGVPWEPSVEASIEKFNPLRFVHKWNVPHLFVHGNKDYRLDVTEATAPYHALLQLGVPTRLVIFPDEGHAVIGHGNLVKWYWEIFRWFDKYVGDKE